MSLLLRVLIIEDEDDDEELILRHLALGGYDIESYRVEDGRSLAEALEASNWDVIIADYRLPQFDALAALRIVGEKDLDIPFLIVSGNIGEQTAVSAMKAGAHDYIMKDNMLRLVPAIEREIRDAAMRRERRLAEQQLKQSHERLRQLAVHLQNVLEEERKHISREIHDELGQRLTGCKFDLKYLASALQDSRPELTERVDSLLDHLGELVRVVRRIATELRPGVLDELGLLAAIEWQLNEFQNRTQISCELTKGVDDLRVEGAKATAVFRIFQETLTNIARHSEATKVWVSVNAVDDLLTLRVHDNGKGVTEAQLRTSRSLGVLGMRERAQIFGGEITIKGIPGKGTTLLLRMSLDGNQS